MLAISTLFLASKGGGNRNHGKNSGGWRRSCWTQEIGTHVTSHMTPAWRRVPWPWWQVPERLRQGTELFLSLPPACPSYAQERTCREERRHSGAVSQWEAAIPRSWGQGYAHIQAAEPSLTEISVDNKRIQFCL